MKRGWTRWLGGSVITALAVGALATVGCDDRGERGNDDTNNSTIPRDRGMGDTSRNLGSDRTTGGGSTGGAINDGTSGAPSGSTGGSAGVSGSLDRGTARGGDLDNGDLDNNDEGLDTTGGGASTQPASNAGFSGSRSRGLV